MRNDITDSRLLDAIVEEYPPNENRLLAVLCQLTTDEILWAIAGCDYGDRKEEYFAALERIQQGLD